MKGQGHILHPMMVWTPWMQLLAVLVALTILFLICTTSAQAGLTPVAVSPATDSLSRQTDCFPKGNNPLFRVRSWYLDFSDICNEAGYEQRGSDKYGSKYAVKIKRSNSKTNPKPLMK